MSGDILNSDVANVIKSAQTVKGKKTIKFTMIFLAVLCGIKFMFNIYTKYWYIIVFPFRIFRYWKPLLIIALISGAIWGGLGYYASTKLL